MAEESPGPDEEDGWCGVCGSAHSEEGDALIFCDGENCTVAVHQLCYGVNVLPGENEPWLCEACAENVREEIVCEICKTPRALGCPFAMKRATRLERHRALTMVDRRFRRGEGTHVDAWVHATCALWIPEASFVDHNTLDVAITGDLSPERGSLRCELCKKPGQCVQCKQKRCAASFHPLCVLRELLGPKEWSESETRWRKGSSTGLGEVICFKHTEEKKALAQGRTPGKRGRKRREDQDSGREKSEYEKEREERIALNASFLASLGLADKSSSSSKQQQQPRKKRKASEDAPMRRSPRERQKNVNYADPLGNRRSAEEIAERKAEAAARKQRKILNAADKAVAQASIDDARHLLRRLYYERAEANRVANQTRMYLAQLARARAFQAQEAERRRQSELVFIEQRRIMQLQNMGNAADRHRPYGAPMHRPLSLMPSPHELHMFAESQKRMAEMAAREEEDRKRDAARAQKAVERALQAEKLREEKRIEKERKDDAKAAARAARDAELAEQRRVNAALRKGLAEARQREKKRAKLASREIAPDPVASDAMIAELLLEEKARVDASKGGSHKKKIVAKRSVSKEEQQLPPGLTPEQAKISATILAQGHLLPPCCFCGSLSDDPESAEGAFIQQVFLWPPTAERPRGSLARAHIRCARLSPEVMVDDHGVYYNVLVAARRGVHNKCEGCGKRGATIGCQFPGCNSKYHLPCATNLTSWVFGGLRKFWCPSHRDKSFAKIGGRFGDPNDSHRVNKILLGAVSGRLCPSCQAYDPEARQNYIGCDGCKTWWHPHCGGVSNLAAVREADAWYCPTCFEDSKKLEETTLCICGAKSSECLNEQMLLCESCDVWHHPNCVGLDAAQFAELSASTDPWYCPKCSSRPKVCRCQKPEKDGEVLMSCDGCSIRFHPACVGIEPEKAAAVAASSELFFCPDCYAKQMERLERKKEETKQRKQLKQEDGEAMSPPRRATHAPTVSSTSRERPPELAQATKKQTANRYSVGARARPEAAPPLPSPPPAYAAATPPRHPPFPTSREGNRRIVQSSYAGNSNNGLRPYAYGPALPGSYPTSRGSLMPFPANSHPAPAALPARGMPIPNGVAFQTSTARFSSNGRNTHVPAYPPPKHIPQNHQQRRYAEPGAHRKSSSRHPHLP